MKLLTIVLSLLTITNWGCGELDVEDHDRGQIRKSGTEVDSHFEYYDDPIIMDPSYELSFDGLPLNGRLATPPWTDTYWPKNKGGIGYRWQTDESHTYALIPYDDALNLSEDELALLSPTEKYDLYVQNRDYALTERTRSENSASTTSWQGYCHGWTMASIHFDEPSPVVMINPDGLRIPFGSSDIKALLTYFQGEVITAPQYGVEQLPFIKEVRSIGTTCLSNSPTDPSCTDSNPGAFHVVMANQIGLRGESFGIDATTTYEKWNQPVHTYQTRIIERKAARPSAKAGVVQEVVVETKFIYTAEIDAQWDMTTHTPQHLDHEKTVTYRLDLNASNQIVDGEWILLVEGGHYTLSELYDYFVALDDNGDGLSDLDKKGAEAALWQYFDFPDYVWLQEAGTFAQDFQQANSKYTLMFNSVTTRRAVYGYLAKLSEIYEASTAE